MDYENIVEDMDFENEISNIKPLKLLVFLSEDLFFVNCPYNFIDRSITFKLILYI